MSTIDDMLDNYKADDWTDVSDDAEYVFDDESRTPLARLQSYVEYCFETYSVLNTLDRDDIQCCVADWGRRRGEHRSNKKMDKRVFGKRVSRKHERQSDGNHVIFIASALIGVSPEDDIGVGWKACVRHELGHAVDYEQRGTSDHSHHFKNIMQQFGHDVNDGQHAHGYAPRVHR